MKEKYNSEKNLQEAFGSYQMPFEQEAFEKFIASLDKEKKKKRVVWWIKYGFAIIPFFFVIIISTYFIFQNINDESMKALSEHSVANIDNVASISEKEELAKTDTKSATFIKDSQNQTTPSTNTNNISTTEQPEPHSTSKGSRTELIETPHHQKSHSVISNNITTNRSESESKSFKVDEEVNKEISPLTVIEPNMNTSDVTESISLMKIETLKNLPLLNFPLPKSEQNTGVGLLGYEVESYTEPFKKYFYLRLIGGIAINDNFGTYDPYFYILKPQEYTYGAALAYKFSLNYAVEFSFSQHDFSVGYGHRESSFMRKSGKRVTKLKAALVSKLWSPINGIELNMTNGLCMIRGDAGGSFGKGSFGQDTPTFIEAATLERFNFSLNTHVLYAGGLQLNVPFSKRVEMSFGSEYNIGFKPWINSQLQYFEGEGVLKTVEAQSKGSFFFFCFHLWS